MAAGSQAIYLRRGRCRHSYLRKQLQSVSCIRDIEKTFVRELAVYLQERFPEVNYLQKVFVYPEVTISNRRTDFIISIPNVAIILLEYKTTEGELVIQKRYLTQTLDTFRKFKLQHMNDFSSNDNVIYLMSILLIRNSRTRKNKLVLVHEERNMN